ncbi:MAG TPA: GDP-mannose 4,6-dehydratase [Verrucomicrobiae bacterium]|nr:GDP-mannose 4,6-dehydratase [Verrucomicrobiae bacterium]
MRTSLVIGASGQDGTFLAELLAKRGDRVVGVDQNKVWSAPAEAWDSVDILKPEQVLLLLQKTQPAECYYLPAYHHSAEDASLSSGDPVLFERSYAIHVRGLIHFLHAIAQSSRHTRLFYAASSHVFGTPRKQPQDENTPLNPENVYGITKTAGIHCCRHFRRELGVFAAAGILYNHESHLRPSGFLSQKIVRGVLAFHRDQSRRLTLGNLDAVVDWGYAGDYAEAMTRILGHPTPEDFVVATGEPHTVREFLQIACEIAGVNWRDCVATDANLLKKKPVVLVGDSGKLQRLTGWRRSFTFKEMIQTIMTAVGQRE